MCVCLCAGKTHKRFIVFLNDVRRTKILFAALVWWIEMPRKKPNSAGESKNVNNERDDVNNGLAKMGRTRSNLTTDGVKFWNRKANYRLWETTQLTMSCRDSGEMTIVKLN